MKIEEFLKSLGNSSEEVANSLEKMGIKGECYNADFCPITKAIYQKFPKISKGLRTLYKITYPRYVSTVYNDIYVRGSTTIVVTWDDVQTIDPVCPKAVVDFVKEFDIKKYPRLIGKTQKDFKKEALSKLTKEEKMALGL